MSEGKKHKLLCVGLACVDIVNVCASYPVEDSDQRSVDQRWQRGGNASNTASVVSLLPNPCTGLFMGTLAKSYELRFIQDELSRSGVDYSLCVYHDGCTCPMSIVIVNQLNGSRTIIHSDKTLPSLSSKDFAGVNLETEDLSWIHIEGRPNEEAIVEFLQRIDDHNNTQPEIKRIRTSVELEKPRQTLVELLDKADVVFISKEFAQFQGMTTKEEAVDKLVHRCRNGATVICPWGEEGAVAKTNTPNCDVIMKAPIYPPERVVDTLGAGDTFVAGCISALCIGRTVEEAIHYGCKIAGAKCGMAGFDGLKNCDQC